MNTVHLYVTLQPVGDKHAATIRREGHGIPLGLTRAFAQRRDAVRWLIENVKAELAEVTGDEDAAA